MSDDQGQMMPPAAPPAAPAPQMAPPPPSTPDEGPKTGKLYTGKAPIDIQIFGGLMWLSGLGSILLGLPLLLLYGLGVLFIILGFLEIRFGSGLFKLQKKSYKGAMIVMAILAAVTVLGMILRKSADATNLVQLAFEILVIVVLYVRRGLFTN